MIYSRVGKNLEKEGFKRFGIKEKRWNY